MRYTKKIERALLAQIEKEPDRPIILPEWAYWKDDPSPWIYVGGQPIRLIRYLYTIWVGEVPDHAGIRNPPGVDPRNVNPFLAAVTPTRKSHFTCPRGHRYTDADYIPGVGQQCQQCKAEKRANRRPNVGDINREKTTCPQGHTLVLRKNGKRKCYECPRNQTAAYRQRQKEKQ